MFSAKELSIINLKYFKVPMCASDVCELESKNGDHWLIIKKQATVPRGQAKQTTQFHYTYILFHRPADNDGFHYQLEFISLLDVILEIINHDDYRLHHKGKTYFDEVVAMYS